VTEITELIVTRTGVVTGSGSMESMSGVRLAVRVRSGEIRCCSLRCS